MKLLSDWLYIKFQQCSCDAYVLCLFFLSRFLKEEACRKSKMFQFAPPRAASHRPRHPSETIDTGS